ncbi:DUF5959 family protein [Streptomyces sp. NRRL F-2799]|uniref:DUF5959 family protein n=1 Tax=Streptomyces sp. NRRL F-2799 TaxID=1463844 RepID=UPI000560CBC7|nr:DUF5959 family protein [Streptomyces sp. NRRL F-2799]
MDLIHLEDADGDRCIVRVTGRLKLGVLTGHDVLRAGVLAHASFVDVRLEPGLFQRDPRSEFPVGAVEFLAGVYGRTIDVPGMPRDFPSENPQLLGLSDRTD